MTLRDKLTARIVAEQAEVQRIKADAISNAQAAKDRIDLLQAALAILTPELEALIEKLLKIGVKVGE